MKLNPQSRLHKGILVADLLSGSWRQSPDKDLDLSESELDEIAPLLYGSGGAALGWWRLRGSHLETTSTAEVLHQAYRIQSLQAAIHEQKIQKVFNLLRKVNVEPLLAKGWAAAKLYPDAALRAYGDIDLCVRPEQFKAAREVVRSPEAGDCWVDLHSRFAEIGDRNLDQLFERSRLTKLNGTQIRIPSLEDHLALLSIHLLKHGAWRPLWLCDVAAAVESAPPDFDWNICLGGNRRRANWIASAIGLAHRLLNANIDNLLSARQVKELPGWLVENVLRQWADPFSIKQPPMSHPLPITHQLRQPGGLLSALRQRWPNPIIATVSVHGDFNGLPRLPYQIGNCALRISHLLFRIPTTLESEH